MNTAVTIRHSSPSHSRNSSPRRQAPTVVAPNKTIPKNKSTRNKGDKKSKSVSKVNDVASEEVKPKHSRKQDTKSALPYGSVKIIQRSTTNLAVLKEDANHRDTSKRRNNPPSAKSRRTQRRKDLIADVTDALEVEFTATPPPPSQTTDSDDSSTGDIPKQNKKNHKSTAHRQPNNSPTKRYVWLGNFFILVLHQYLTWHRSKPASRPSRPRRRSGSILEISERHSSTTKATTVPLSRTPPNDFMFGQPAINPLYAGPTFSNSPAPSALPMPGVRPTLGRSHDDNLFMMDDDIDTNANILRQKSLDLLDMIGVDRPRSEPVHPRQQPPQPIPAFEAHMPVPYNVTYHQPHPIYHQQLPFVMTTSHKIQPDLSPSLSEIQHNLRTMLKIQDGM
ncbi:hypothetical protein K450DRAFT_236585 [Umbelopsis ramanniana AG]|uniref:Uncharacterized protein n=1 Tax=Umbelopsis ramanniana AG TaxID=1314678 RepID=A0AAD5EBH5_UMBRA|nr:uncharacterized protein K450DRAFT_236585 [Umbelopsis ramanniana AG]KAI8580643.1 hypothetical protein K450DRAFT_236585 [Umbelopsis ramanniana AG]